MAVAFRASSFVSSNIVATADPIVVAPVGLADGDLILVQIAIGANTTMVDPPGNGFTLIHELGDSGGDGRIGAMYKLASGEGASWTFTGLFGGGAVTGIAGALCYTGVHQTTPTSGTATEAAPATSTTPACTAFLPGVDNCMLVSMFGCDPSAGMTGTEGTGWTERGDAALSGEGFVYFQEKLQTTATSEGGSFTASTTDTFGCIQVALQPAAGGGRVTRNTRTIDLGTAIGMNWRSG